MATITASSATIPMGETKRLLLDALRPYWPAGVSPLLVIMSSIEETMAALEALVMDGEGLVERVKTLPIGVAYTLSEKYWEMEQAGRELREREGAALAAAEE